MFAGCRRARPVFFSPFDSDGSFTKDEDEEELYRQEEVL